MIQKSEPIKLNLFKISIFIIYLLYFLAFLGITYIDKSKIRLLSISVASIICVILMLRFHPFRHHEITDFDRTIIFSAASFLFINTFVTEIYSQYIKDSIKNINSFIER